MNTPKVRLRSSATSSCSDVWFVSFGDLLTLLVCFFLVLTPSASPPRELQEDIQQVRARPQQYTTSGTKLADESDGGASRRSAFPLFRGGTRGKVLSDTPAVGTDGQRGGNASQGTLGRQVVVRLCNEHTEERDIGTLLDMLDHLGELSHTARLEVGSSCDRWRNEFVPYRDVLAVVTFDEGQRYHG